MKRKTKAAWSWPWGQYTSDNFSVFGVEYYFQSEGIRALNSVSSAS